jgi:hypothetical protein
MLKQVLRGEQIWRAAAPFLCLFALADSTAAQSVSSFAGDAQHTAVYQPAARELNRIRWFTSIDLNNTGAFAHYGAPLITSSNTVVVPVKTAAGFQINVLDGAAAPQNFRLRGLSFPHKRIPVYQPALAAFSGGRLYYPAAGGTVYCRQSRFERPRCPDQRVFTPACRTTSSTPPALTPRCSSTRRSQPTAMETSFRFPAKGRPRR